MKRFSILPATKLAICDAQPGGQMPLANCASLLVITSGRVPEWVQLIPPGEFKPADAREAWKLVDPKKVIAASQEFLPTMAIDYDHGTDLGGSSAAAAWIKQLATECPEGKGGIWGRVEWTKEGAEAVASLKFRFLSPVFGFDQDTREVIAILRAALTNNPALRQLKALASVQPTQEKTLDLAKLRKLLGLPDTATDAEIMSAIEAMCQTSAAMAAKKKGVCSVATAAGIANDFDKLDDNAFTAICTKLKSSTSTAALLSRVAEASGLSGQAASAPGENEVTAICAKLKVAANGDKSVEALQGQVDKLQLQIATLSTKSSTATATAAVDEAIKSGVLSPAQRDWAIGTDAAPGYAVRDPEGFKAFCAKQPKILPGGRIAPAGKPGEAAGELDENQLAICRMTGVKPEDFKKNLAAQKTEEETV